MEFVSGFDLYEYIDKFGPLKELEVSKIMKSLF